MIKTNKLLHNTIKQSKFCNCVCQSLAITAKRKLYSSNNNSRITKLISKLRHPTYFSSSQFISASAMSTVSKIVAADRIKNEKESIWNEFIQLAIENKPFNLGQGLPDYEAATPDHIKTNLVNAVTSENFLLNQYTRGYGHPRLVNIIASFYSKLVNQQINPKEGVLVTVGAYESLFCAINAFVDQGDEVIIIEPFFDCYEPMVKLAGGISKCIPLRLNNIDQNKPTTSADWQLDMKELEAKISSKTKMLILNNPHNPVGKVFSREELTAIGNLCIKYDILVLSDEVYEHLVIDGEHVRIASLPGMWDRTITVGSAGKTFSVTGWKLGWSYGPPNLIKYVQLYHQNCIYTCATPLQEAVAQSFEIEVDRLGTDKSYWKNLADSLRIKRNFIVDVLTRAKMNPTIPEGGYFIMANTSHISKKYDLSHESGDTKDHKLARWLSKNKKFQGIPPSAFYSQDNKTLAEDYIRLCYFKGESTLNEAEKIIFNL